MRQLYEQGALVGNMAPGEEREEIPGSKLEKVPSFVSPFKILLREESGQGVYSQ